MRLLLEGRSCGICKQLKSFQQSKSVYNALLKKLDIIAEVLMDSINRSGYKGRKRIDTVHHFISYIF